MSQRQPDLFDRAWSAFTEALARPIAENWRANGIAAGVFVIFPLLLLTSPVLFLDDMALDVFVPLDGAWRMHHGQWPHIDFYTPIGALYYALLGLAGPGAKAPIYANLILLPFTAFAAFFLTRDRLPGPIRLALVLYIAFMTISPRTLDQQLLVSHLASYNRHGWVFTSLVLTGVLLQPKTRTTRDSVVEGILLTLCVVACFYLKVTFFALSGAVLIAVVLFGGTNRFTALATGVASLALVGLAVLLTETTGAYIDDLQRAAVAGSDGEKLLRTDRFGSIFNGNRSEILVLFAMWIGLIRTSKDETEENAASFEVVRLAAVFALCGLVTSQSHDHAMPVLAVLIVVSAKVWHDRWRVREDHPFASNLTWAAALAFLALTISLDGFTVVKHAVMSRSSAAVPLANVEGPISDVRIPKVAPDTESPLDRVLEGTLPYDAYDNLNPPWARDDAIVLDDAVELLERNGLTDKRIASLTFSSSFPWMLQAPPPKHMPAWHDFRRTFSNKAAGDLQLALSDSDVVLVPHIWRIEGIWDVYGPQVEAEFDKRDSTKLWTVWVRR